VKQREKLFFLVGLVAVLVLSAAIVLPLFQRASNCGGNTAALSHVGHYVLVARAHVTDSPDRKFLVTMVSSEQRKTLVDLGRNHWIPNARFLVSTAPLVEQGIQPRRIVIVCDTPYRNVPRRWFGSAPPAHAAGFADGSTCLISSVEFAALDRSEFALLDELFRE
jgi:hypothetical protein